MDNLKGVYSANDYADQLQSEYLHGVPPGLETGFAQLDNHYRVKTSQWTVVTGMPSSGKSTFVDNLMVNMARLHDWKFLVCSPENQPVHRHIESLVEIYSGKQFINPNLTGFPKQALTQAELATSVLFINQHFQFICPDETDFHIDYILQLASEVKREFDYQGFLIDPYNELEHKRPAGFTETEYISSLLSKYRRFVRAEKIHAWFVAHPTKQTAVRTATNEADLKTNKLYQKTSLYDISGGAHWYNKADNGIVVYRNEHLQPETTTVSVDKIRFRECGKRGQVDFYYDFLCNRLVEHTSELLSVRTKL